MNPLMMVQLKFDIRIIGKKKLIVEQTNSYTIPEDY